MVKQSFAGTEGFSTEVYKSIFSDNLVLVKNSVFVGNLSAFFSTIAGLLVAICVWVAGKKMGKVLETILLISMVSPPFIASLAYIQLFGRNGLITKGILGLSLNPYGWLGVVVMQTLFFASLNALMILGMLKKMDMSLVRASFDLGASSGYTLWRIVKEKKVVLRYALKNAAPAILTAVGQSFGSLITGTIVTETLFNIPGLGMLTMGSINRRDVYVIQGVVLFVTLLYVLVNLVVDILYGFVDPRLQPGRNK